MHGAFLRSDSYGPPPHLRPSAGNGPALLAGPAVRKIRATAGGSHVHHVPIGQVASRYYPGSITTPTPQTFSVGLPTGSWRPASELTAPVEASGHALHPGPISARYWRARSRGSDLRK